MTACPDLGSFATNGPYKNNDYGSARPSLVIQWSLRPDSKINK